MKIKNHNYYYIVKKMSYVIINLLIIINQIFFNVKYYQANYLHITIILFYFCMKMLN
jgi:hypothetical protein